MLKSKAEMAKDFTLHDLPQEERPRERLREVGIDNLSTQELLALIVERGVPGCNVLTIAQSLLAQFGNLQKIKEASLEELQEVKGIGFATACKLKAAFKLGEKVLTKRQTYGQKIETPEDVYGLLRNDLANKKKEHFKLLSLTSRNHLISIDEISVGSLNANLVHPREVFSPAIANHAAQVILVHNHPSGEIDPSEDDLTITKRLAETGKILGIEVTDHVIVSQNNYLSFKAKNLI